MKTANAANVAFDAFELDLLHEAVCAQLERLAGLQAELAGWDAPGEPAGLAPRQNGPAPGAVAQALRGDAR